MTHRKPNRGGRPAFTLVELMVVITIIAILVALTAGAVIKGLGKGPETQASSEIAELTSKLAFAARDVNVRFLPSRLHLSKQNNYNVAGSQLDQDSVRFLQERFGKNTCFRFTPLSGANSINWNGSPNPNEEIYLEGEQCLVFHLGGIPLTANGTTTMLGFSLDPQNPAAAPTNGSRRGGPYFEFQPNRLQMFTSTAFQGAAFPGPYGAFPRYLDPWVQPGAGRQSFAYFASTNPEGAGQYDKYGTSDCPALLAGTTNNPLIPYQSANSSAAQVLWLNPSSCQIMSAGKDGKWGVGGILPASGTTDQYGKDDQSNFSAHLLGVAP